MSETNACVAAMVVIAVMVVTLVWFGRLSESGYLSRLHAVREALKELRSSESVFEKVGVLMVCSAMIFRFGYWSLVATIGTAGFYAAAAVCGPNPWPYVRDILRDFYDYLGGRPPTPHALIRDSGNSWAILERSARGGLESTC